MSAEAEIEAEAFVRAECEKGHRILIDDGDGGIYRCPACALTEARAEADRLRSDYAALMERVDFLRAETQRQASGWAADKVRATAAEARLTAAEAVLDRAEAEAVCVFNDDVHVETAIVRTALAADPVSLADVDGAAS